VLVDQTLWMVVRPTLAGNRARVRLTHRDGDDPATIASATRARSDVGAAAQSGTMRRLTFRGSGSGTMQPGAEVIADADAPLPFGPAVLTRLRADAIAMPGTCDVVIFEGTNDLGGDEELIPRQLIDGLATLVRRAKRSGLRVHLGTLTPSGGASGVYGGSGFVHTNTRREAVNRWIRSQRPADSVIDFYRAVRDPAQPR